VKQHYATETRKQNVLRFYNFIKKKKDEMTLGQICSLFAFSTGLSTFTVEDYKAVLIKSGIIKVEDDTVIEMIDIEKK